MTGKFIVIVLDGFGIGAMDDAAVARPGDEKANTLGSILKDCPDMKLPNLEKLGLMNAYGQESSQMKFSKTATYGKAELMHFGADTFMGHQEIMGTLPKKPDVHPFQEKVDVTAEHLKAHGHKVEIIERAGLRYLVCDDYVTVEYRIAQKLSAPVKKGSCAGAIYYKLGGMVLREYQVETTEDMEKLDFEWCLRQVLKLAV